MNKSLEAFAALTAKALPAQRRSNGAVIYTRVSTKEQAENNGSLETQKKYCDMYADRRGIQIVEYFGGTHESARTDERKEFQRMLEFVKRRKDVSFIIVYSYDRLSRSGMSASVVLEKLKKEGVYALSATQEVDSSTSSGTFQQDLFLLFSKFDNDLRRDKTVGGMQDKLRNGFIVGAVPFGYTNTNPGRGKDPVLVINEDGKLLRKAFMLKYKYNWDNVRICNELRSEGFRKDRKNLHDYLRNPVYCGVIVSSLIPGEAIEAKHPPIISKEIFQHINQILDERRQKGLQYDSYKEELPLKGFVKSATDETNLTGYLVKSRNNRPYYKNNVNGAKENVSAEKLHNLFIELLGAYTLADPKFIEPMKAILLESFDELSEESKSSTTNLENQLIKLEADLKKVKRRHALGEVDKEVYEEFKAECEAEINQIGELLSKSTFKLSNIEKMIRKAIEIALDLPKMLVSANVDNKKQIQKMLFPEGLVYDFKKGEYRTLRVNVFFQRISVISRVSGGLEITKGIISDALSSCVAGTRLERATFGL